MKFRILVASLFVAVLATGCTGHGQESSRREIDAKVQSALVAFGETVKGGDALVAKADGVLVFPDIIKGGIGIGGEYGEGALLMNGRTVDYYNLASGSIGFQLGVQVKSQILIFLDPHSLDTFRRSNGWEVGLDGSVAVVNVGAGGQIDSKNIQEPIVGFIFSNKGLMYNVSLEGTKVTKVAR